jgi:hypothetical protein
MRLMAGVKITGLAVVVLLVSLEGQLARAEQLVEEYRGMTLVAREVKTGVNYQTNVYEKRAALDKMKAALELLYANSPFSVTRIDALKRSGKVLVIYDPDFPKQSNKRTSIIRAAFIPHYNTMSGSTDTGHSTRLFS